MKKYSGVIVRAYLVLGRVAFLPRQEPKTPVRMPVKWETKPILEKRIREKSRRIRWAEHLTRLGKKKNTLRVLVGKPKGKNHFENSAIYKMILLKWIFNNWNERAQTGLIFFRTGTSDDLLRRR
jgi:hypothetical protein